MSESPNDMESVEKDYKSGWKTAFMQALRHNAKEPTCDEVDPLLHERARRDSITHVCKLKITLLSRYLPLYLIEQRTVYPPALIPSL